MAEGLPRRDPLARLRHPRPLVVAVGLAAVMVLILIAVAATPQGSRWNGDVELYLASAAALLDGTLGVATFPLFPPFLSSYLPLALLPMIPPLFVSRELPLYAFAFGVEMCALTGVGVLLVVPVARRAASDHPRIGAVATYVAFALLCAFVIPLRFDIVPSILVLAAIAAATGGQALLAGLLLGAGAAIKVYPALVIPVLLGWYWFRSERRQAWIATVGFIVAAGIGLLLYLPFLPASPLDVLREQSGRGLELESIPGSVLAGLGALGVSAQPDVVYANGSFNIVGAGVDGALRLVAILQPLVLLGALAAIALRFERDRRSGLLGVEHLTHGMALLLVGLLLTNRVFSPQYMVWLLPLVPFLRWPQRRVGLAAAGMTLLVFPFLYDPLVDLSAPAIGLVLARNLALLVLLAMLASDLVTGRIGRSAAMSASAKRTVGA